MAVPCTVYDGWHGGIRLDRSDEPRPTPWYEQIYPFGRLHQCFGSLSAGVLEELDPVGREPGSSERAPYGIGDGQVGAEGIGGAAQDDGVAGSNAEPGGIGRHVGSGLVYHGDDAEWDADAVELHPVVQRPASGLATHRIGQGGDVAETGGHGGDPLLVQSEPVDEGAGDPLALRLCHVGPIRLEHGRSGFFHASGHAEQGLPP